MKKLLACMLVLAMLCLAGCGAFSNEPWVEPSATQAAERSPVFTEVPRGYEFDSYFAATPEFFYAVVMDRDAEWPQPFHLYRVPFSDIGKRERITLPETEARVSICGVSPLGLYAHALHSVYFIPHGSGQAEAVLSGEDIAAPWYNAMSNSLLYWRMGEEPQVEALAFDSGEQVALFQSAYPPSWQDTNAWHTLEDGSVAVMLPTGSTQEPNILHFDANNHAWLKMLNESESFERLAVEDIYWWGQESITIGDARFEIRRTPFEDFPDNSDALFYRIDQNSQEKIIAEWVDGYNNGVVMRRLGDMIMLTESVYGGAYFRRFYALYDPAASDLFSVRITR